VTGASRGIGREIALAFAAEGADVAVNYHQHAEAAAEVVAHVRRLWGFTVRLETWEDERQFADVVECR
jgi:NAD(P)-dependent dehydrogenase (short-subunit alcohol dehydrogenase family)